jgi:hypothetical protein
LRELEIHRIMYRREERKGIEENRRWETEGVYEE